MLIIMGEASRFVSLSRRILLGASCGWSGGNKERDRAEEILFGVASQHVFQCSELNRP